MVASVSAVWQTAVSPASQAVIATTNLACTASGNSCCGGGTSNRTLYYAVTLPDEGVSVELTTAMFSAIHRYTFAADGGELLIDPADPYAWGVAPA